jgi:plasmid stabilization system protein ParE
VRLRYTRPALADLGAILDYIAGHSPKAPGVFRPRAAAEILSLIRQQRIAA